MFNPATFPTLQQNPILQGFNAAQGMQRNNLQNQNLAIQNQQAPQQLALKQLLAQISQQNANNSNKNIALQYEKLKSTQQNALNRLTQNQAVQAAMAADPVFAKAVLTHSKNFALDGLQQPMQQQGTPQQQMPMQTQGAPQQQAPMQQQGMPAPQSTISPSTLQAGQDASQSLVDKNSRTTNQLDQFNYGKTFDNVYNQAKPLFPAVAGYSGPIGQTELLAAMAKSGLGHPSQQYKDYRKYTDSYRPTLAKEYTKASIASGKGGTEEDRKKDQELIPKASLFTTPATFTQRANTLPEILHGVTGTLGKSLAQLHQQGSPSPSPSQTQAQPSAAGGGTTLMTGTDGKRYHVKNDQVSDAISSHGWRVAGG